MDIETLNIINALRWKIKERHMLLGQKEFDNKFVTKGYTAYRVKNVPIWRVVQTVMYVCFYFAHLYCKCWELSCVICHGLTEFMRFLNSYPDIHYSQLLLWYQAVFSHDCFLWF